ncbi:hypothetical protein Vadar_003907 [Vaccinium darrowii]|uniref:Uncharacterized protein n=1 Tax=Vaccinium darrowii TaxID=229202 RepID=A0ACB7WY73_9ERIC|nr:hypothetical protein Vadar_003907 [Vaccinium darrowii]
MRLSGSLYVTCNTFYKEVTTVKNAIAKMELSDDPKLLLLAKGMHLKFDKYWGKFDKINQMLLYANVLDPHYKFEYVRWSLRKYLTEREVESKVVEIKEGMKKVYNWYEKRTLEHEEAEASNVETSKNKEKNGKRSLDLSEALDSEFDQHMEEETNMMRWRNLNRRFWKLTWRSHVSRSYNLEEPCVTEKVKIGLLLGTGKCYWTVSTE